MQIRRFEEIDGWKEARKLTPMVYRLTARTPFGNDFGLAGQVQRAAVSVMGNIAEGFDSGPRAEFIRFLGYARRSTSEVPCHLYVALDPGYVNRQEFSMTDDQAEVVRKLLSAFVRYLRVASAHSRMSSEAVQPANRPTGVLA